MGGVILFFLFVAVLVILLSPAMQARGRESREAVERAAHDAVVRRLEAQRRRKSAEKGAAGPESGPETGAGSGQDEAAGKRPETGKDSGEEQG